LVEASKEGVASGSAVGVSVRSMMGRTVRTARRMWKMTSRRISVFDELPRINIVSSVFSSTAGVYVIHRQPGTQLLGIEAISLI
jgi:hypothetical protein